MLARKSEPLIYAFLCGCVVGLIGGIAVHDFSMAAHAGERASCRDRPGRTAMMVRAPGEAHSTEWCGQIMRFGSPEYVPELGHPLKPKQEGR